jgi:hypothetical protein
MLACQEFSDLRLGSFRTGAIFYAATKRRSHEATRGRGMGGSASYTPITRGVIAGKTARSERGVYSSPLPPGVWNS